MSEYKNKYEALDAFWDISSLVPNSRPIRALKKSTSTVEISNGTTENDSSQNQISDSVITRNIPTAASRTESALVEADCYKSLTPLIHKVTLYKGASSYDFYADFCAQANEYWDIKGEECPYFEFFSYVSQYDQLTVEQRNYYFWWRECLRNGKYIETNICYINLFFFELINIKDKVDHYYARELMIKTAVNYAEILKGRLARYIRWICEYSLIHKLLPPDEHSRFLVKNAVSLKEYFVRVSKNDVYGWACALLEYCCSYDYKTSKFAKDEALELFDTHVPKALSMAVEYLSTDGQILGGLPFGDCKLTVTAFESAVCASHNRFTIEVDYCSFSRSHELRFLVGDIVKYCENKIRAYIFVKSRLTVYSLPNEIIAVIDNYFDTYLPRRSRPVPQKPERQEYDVLYDLPVRKLDVSNAARIESESWETTRELVEAFDEADMQTEPIVEEITDIHAIPNEEITLLGALGKYASAVKALADRDAAGLELLSHELGKPMEALVDAINEIAVDVIGDIIIDGADGDFVFIEDYREMI